jgi:membrane protease YdiL (CAAX protease family)
MEMIRMNKHPLLYSIFIYIISTVLFFCSLLFFLPFLVQIGFKQIEAYLLSAGIILFLLLIFAIILFKLENKKETKFFDRFRLIRITKKDLLVAVIGIIAILVFDGGFFAINIIVKIIFGIDLQLSKLPDFTGISNTIKGEYNVIPLYFLYLFFNIFGEELLWRGFLLPIQEVYFKKYAWFLNGIFWLAFHLLFGISVFIMLPLLFILPYLVQRQKNTWVGIIIHSFTGLIGFFSLINGIF